MNILYADEAIVVVDKPAGLAVLPEGWDKDAPYVVQTLEQQFGSKIWIVHRLDKSTSGVMIFARTGDAHRALNRQFEHHEADKIYRLILEGVPDWSAKIATYPIRVSVGHKHRTVVDPRQGKPAETRFEILERFQASALAEAHLLSGRTHQIRAHCRALGYPLLGDALYGSQPTALITRPALHSYRLTITHPTTGQLESFAANYPEDFLKVLERLNA